MSGSGEAYLRAKGPEVVGDCGKRGGLPCEGGGEGGCKKKQESGTVVLFNGESTSRGQRFFCVVKKMEICICKSAPE